MRNIAYLFRSVYSSIELLCIKSKSTPKLDSDVTVTNSIHVHACSFCSPKWRDTLKSFRRIKFVPRLFVPGSSGGQDRPVLSEEGGVVQYTLSPPSITATLANFRLLGAHACGRGQWRCPLNVLRRPLVFYCSNLEKCVWQPVHGLLICPKKKKSCQSASTLHTEYRR